MARAMMMRGPVFWERYPQAAKILNQTDIEPWQKKSALIDWLVASERMQETVP